MAGLRWLPNPWIEQHQMLYITNEVKISGFLTFSKFCWILLEVLRFFLQTPIVLIVHGS